jgi:hypothetical protein
MGMIGGSYLRKKIQATRDKAEEEANLPPKDYTE